ncbi:hypothetical protein HMPREF9629_01998 [Peptoanaerobacter stomatis]|uniref:Uncharacterized protein n=1 Tax=Peptoanaerobacter stomatis TaxID=796937 RepID=G9X0R2_9FIRM|nr:hypothetical protein [Peptoanaerobacter stomatis]EHL15065.1 hypothetical protein HMPREF9629_01998 [Peptoanaerobacter stomatis]
MEIVGIIILILGFVASVIVVNAAYRLFMRLLGADSMFFNVKKKLIAIVVVWLVISGSLLKFFGIA